MYCGGAGGIAGRLRLNLINNMEAELLKARRRFGVRHGRKAWDASCVCAFDFIFIRTRGSKFLTVHVGGCVSLWIVDMSYVVVPQAQTPQQL
jgi:hypothetical protein